MAWHNWSVVTREGLSECNVFFNKPFLLLYNIFDFVAVAASKQIEMLTRGHKRFIWHFPIQTHLQAIALKLMEMFSGLFASKTQPIPSTPSQSAASGPPPHRKSSSYSLTGTLPPYNTPCKYHQSGYCKFAKDCRYLHILGMNLTLKNRINFFNTFPSVGPQLSESDKATMDVAYVSKTLFPIHAQNYKGILFNI